MTGIAERARASVRRLEPADCAEWLAFRSRTFGPEARQVDPAWLSWQAANPDHDGELPEAWISRRDGSIVGSQGAIPFRLVEDGRPVEGSWAVDLMVDPAWRLRGVGPAVTEVHARSHELTGSVGISDAAYRAYLRAGWRDLGAIPTWVRTRDVDWVLDELGWQGGRAAAARAAAAAGLTASRLLGLAVARMSGARIVPIDRFDERVDRLWAAASRRYPVIAARDARALGWRIDAVPDAERLRRWYLLQGERVRGYVVARLERRRERDVFAILDYLATPAWMPALLAQIIALPEARAASAVSVRTLSPGNDLSFLAAGFLRLDPESGGIGRVRWSGTPCRFMVHPGARQDRPAFHRERWFVTAADSDLAVVD